MSFASPWARFGYIYGVVMQAAIETVVTHGSFAIVQYEQIAREPDGGFRDTFGRLGFSIPHDFDGVIRRYCYSSIPVVGKHQVERTSGAMLLKWRRELTARQRGELRAGFMRSPLTYYRTDEDWGTSVD